MYSPLLIAAGIGLGLVGLYLLWRPVLFGQDWLSIMRSRFEPEQCRLVSRSGAPDLLQPIYEVADQALAAFNFQYAHTIHHDRTSYTEPAVLFYHVYANHEMHTYATVMPNSYRAGRYPFTVSFTSFLADGRTIETSGGLQSSLPLPSHFHLQEQDWSSLDRQWQMHQATLQTAMQRTAAVLCSPETYVERSNQISWDVHDYRIQQGCLVPAGEPNQWRCSAWYALKWVWKIYRGQKRSLENELLLPDDDIHPPQVAPDHPAQIASETAMFRMLSEHRRQQRHRPYPGQWIGKTLLFLLSVLAFAWIWGVTFSWTLLPILIGVLLVHELGHIAGMLIFGYRHFQLLFIPLLGAAVIWPEREEAVPWQQFVVILMGPLPGLILGFVALFYAQATENDTLYTVGVLAIVFNYLNLLPFLPLDGGRLVELLFWRRSPWAQFAFMLLSSLFLR